MSLAKLLLIDNIRSLGWEAYQTGSRAICTNPPEDSDDDWLLYKNGWPLGELEELGFYAPDDTAENYAETNTIPLKHPNSNLNLIVAIKPEVFKRWKLATDVCKELHVKCRASRVAIFKAIRNAE